MVLHRERSETSLKPAHTTLNKTLAEKVNSLGGELPDEVQLIDLFFWNGDGRATNTPVRWKSLLSGMDSNDKSCVRGMVGFALRTILTPKLAPTLGELRDWLSKRPNEVGKSGYSRFDFLEDAFKRVDPNY